MKYLPISVFPFFFFYFYRKGQEGSEKKREKHGPVATHLALNTGLCSEWESNKPFGRFFNFWKSLRRIGIKCLNVWQNSLGKPFGPGLLFLGRFLMVVLISSLLISLFRFSTPSGFNLGRVYISRNLLISSRLWNSMRYSLSRSYSYSKC